MCATPLALYYGEIVSVYPTESFIVPAVALLAHRVARHADRFNVFLLLPVLAIGGGFRPTILVLMLPACLVGIGFGRPRIRDVAASALVAGGVVLAWSLPMLAKTGGWHAYSRASRALYDRQFSQTSIFYGASFHLVAYNAASTIGATAMVALPAIAVVLLAFGPQKAAWGTKRPAMWILLASLLPYSVTFFAIQLGKPGYVLANLPIVAVVAGGLVAASARAVLVAATVLVIMVAGYLVLPQWPMPWRLDAFFPTAHAVHLQDQEALGLRHLSASCPPSSCTIVSFPGSRRFWYHDPSSPSHWYAPGSRVLSSDEIEANQVLSGEVIWIGTTVPRVVSDLATPEGSYGTWLVYQSRGPVTDAIVRQGIG